MTAVQVVGLTGFLATCLAFAWGCYWKSRFHSAKAEVYQEFADTFSRMNVEGLFRKAKDQKRAQAKRHYMSLALCDPRVRDGLYDALQEADEHWKRIPHMDGER